MGAVKIGDILKNLKLGDDSVYSYDFINVTQADGIKLRESVSANLHEDYLLELSHHHSIPVMDKEIDIFLNKIPKNGVVVDVGGCWGWHWRRNKYLRPDVVVFIVDFIRSNLIHAKNILGDQINNNIFLVHGDALSLNFRDNTFDGWWSVQTLQHIPDFEKVVVEARRVLKSGGVFANYSLNDQMLLKLIYRLFGKTYHVKGQMPGVFYLARASNEQFEIVGKIFPNSVRKRYSEVIFCPELHMVVCGKKGSLIGKVDSLLSSGLPVFSWIARQQSFHALKK